MPDAVPICDCTDSGVHINNITHHIEDSYYHNDAISIIQVVDKMADYDNNSGQGQVHRHSSCASSDQYYTLKNESILVKFKGT